MTDTFNSLKGIQLAFFLRKTMKQLFCKKKPNKYKVNFKNVLIRQMVFSTFSNKSLSKSYIPKRYIGKLPHSRHNYLVSVAKPEFHSKEQVKLIQLYDKDTKRIEKEDYKNKNKTKFN